MCGQWLGMSDGLASAVLDGRRRRPPDFVVHVAVRENTTARLFAYRDGDSSATGDQRRALNPGLSLGLLMLNASINHDTGFNTPVPVPSTTVHEDDDATGS